VSREGAPSKQSNPERPAGTPIWVWVVYAFGLLAAAILLFSILFTLGAALLARDVPVTYEFSVPATTLWGGLLLAAVVTWVVRRRQGR